MKKSATKAPNNSAIGTAIHTPACPYRCGRTRIHPTIKIKVLENDMIAEDLPSENAVNKAEAKIPNPIMIKDREYREKPFSAIS